ncbi:MAG TPA: 2-oxoglutarate dehydrogenase E1 component [Tepidisphaeraceae bacterium]|jgi:2-oxoglutarate dehydrogenase E1 component|nr:2-oxoglutarate dehydrogenase E1 component [Tepidisphaeraceae bacterium]
MESFDIINRGNADYIDRLYQQYQSDTRSVDPYWQAFFAGFEAAGGRAAALTGAFQTSDQPDPTQARVGVDTKNLVHSYRELGHLLATLDPLGHHRPSHALLDLSQFGLSDADMDKRVTHTDFQGPFDGTLRDLIDKLRATYCSTLGVEFVNISEKAQREWLIQRMEPIFNRPILTNPQRQALLYELVAVQGFEDFLVLKQPGQKRFGIEGAESLIPLLNTLVDDGASLGILEVVMGTAHRGRLNVLAHVVNKPYEAILREFEGQTKEKFDGDGDVKYHLGYAQDRLTKSKHNIHIALSYNPSHLELVDPVVVGIVRAKQNYRGDHETRTRVAPILIHGDAAFCGQGIVHETLGLSELPYYRTGGTIHVIINNQIGFTTLPRQGRFTPYPTDVAKMIQAPIFHVNGDDPEACIHAAGLAIAFRQKFHCDVMIDLWCYRKNGHNEQDEPSFTQPVMAREIAAKTSVRDLYAQQLIEQGVVTPEQFEGMKAEARSRLDEALAHARDTHSAPASPADFGGVWKGFARNGDWSAITRVPADLLRKVGEGATRVPEGFTVHPKLKTLLTKRQEMSIGKAPIDWGGAEMLALGSLLLEGTPVRFVGQDAQRGTFTHRHGALRDYNTGEKYVPLANIAENQAPIILVNTMLSELAVLGFEYGFSSADPRNLVVWEAQFGDFVNGAQPIIDQFIVAAESKWGKMSGLVMLLPHGYEGSGPEHSYAYLDRFLALSAEENIQVVYPSTPAQYFHVLRRQMRRNFRKPLVLMMPKSMLRDASSTLTDLTEGSFHLVIDDPAYPSRDRVRRLLLCSGKIYFALEAARKKAGLEDIAIVRVEQLYPYPKGELQSILAKYRNAHEVCWVQEEPKNRGAWVFMSDRLEPMLPETAVLSYFGREESASPAVGSKRVSDQEEAEIISRALELPAAKPTTPPAAADESQLEKVAHGSGVGGD